MGLYLHDARDTRNYRELATFKELRGQVSFRLPDDLEQGVYSLQVRKSSRGRVNGSIWKRDSLSIASMDSPSLSLGLITPPRVQLVGNTEIFEGESTDLQLFSVDIQGKRAGELGEGVENYVTLNNGITYALANSFISVSPPVTETFTITSVNNICGTGKGFGEATVVVYPLSGKRMAARGFLRSQPQFNEWYYETAMRLCAGVQDSLDVIFYGWEKNETPGVERIALTDGQGGSGLPVTVSRLEEVFFPPPPVGGRMMRLWFEVPETAAGGNSYRIKAVPADPAVAATPLPQPGTIFEPPVASLSGSVITQAGGNVEALVKFTGIAPWFFTVTDASEQVIFNNFPTAQDSSLRRYTFEPTYMNEYPLTLKTDKAGEYKVSKVFNWSCGYGKTEGVFKVELILGNEITSPREILLYPNPVQDQLHFDLSDFQSAVLIEVFDLQGKRHIWEVFNEIRPAQKQVMNLRRLQAGAYLVKISSEGLQQVKRILKY